MHGSCCISLFKFKSFDQFNPPELHQILDIFSVVALLLLVVSLISLLAQSRLYRGELCLLRVQYHSVLGHSQGCLTTEEVRLCYSMYSSHWDKPMLQYFIGGTCELPLYWIIPGVNTKESTLMIHAVPTGIYPVYKYANHIGFGLQTFGALYLHIPHNNPNT